MNCLLIPLIDRPVVASLMEGDLAIKEHVMRAKLYPYRVAGRSKGQRAGLVHRAPTQEVS